jgi:hypothetical protein
MIKHLASRIALAAALASHLATTAVICAAEAGVNEPGWWLTPHRMLQTNLREIDATMDTDQYVREVQEFGANVVLFNVGGIVANYPTELKFHWRNTHMDEDLVGTVLPKLHAAGVKMVGRFDFSKINENYAAEHPEWLYVSEKGDKVNYNGQVHTCLMGGYQQDYMYKILKEATTKYPLDGVFFNMIGFPQVDYSRVFHGVCQCTNCKTSFKSYSGLDLPKHDGDPEALRMLKQWQRHQIDTQFGRVRDLIKSVREDIAICTYTEEHIDVIRKESGSPIGEEPWDDLQKAQWTLLTNKDRQLSNASNHFHRMIFRHSGVTASLHYRRLWQQVVNGAWLDFYCLGPLQRLEDRAGLGPASQVYRFHAANEKWMLHTETAAEVGLFHHRGDDYWGWIQLLSECHIPFQLVSFDHSELQQYKALIVPDSGQVDADGARQLDAYVQAGGKLLLSGRMPASLTCLGKPTLKKTWPERHSMYVRIRPEDKVRLAVPGLRDFDLVQLRGEFFEYTASSGARPMLKLVHDVTYGPPEKCYIHSVSIIPALWTRPHGDGAAAFVPFQLGAMYREWGNQGQTLLAVGVLDNLLKANRRLKVNTSPLVEVTHRRDPKGKFEWVALLNHSGHLENTTHPPIPIHDIRIGLKTDRPVRRVVSLSNGKELKAAETAAREMRAVLSRLEAFEIVLFEYAP